MSIDWRSSDRKYCNLDYGYIGKCKVFNTQYDGVSGSKQFDAKDKARNIAIAERGLLINLKHCN